MDLHEEDMNHLKNAHASAMEVVKSHPDWVKIDCEHNGEMKSMDNITEMIMKEI